MTSKVKTIATDEPAYDAFRQLAKEYQLSNTELLAAMVQYFRVTKADPRQPTGPDLTTSLAKITAKLADLDKRTIGFIREQEKTYLKPMLAQVQALQQLSGGPAPAAEGPGELRPEQVTELFGWYARMLRRVIVPGQQTPRFQAEALPPAPAKGQEDAALVPLRNGLFNILRLALHPDILTPVASAPPIAAPAAGAAPAVSPPTRPA